ncbi:hypothetical protein JCM3766R1_005600 [Sporobolomyces carnicolor]
MFNKFVNEYHALQQHEQENLERNRGNAAPPASFNPLQLFAYLSQLDLTNPPPALKQALKNPYILVGVVVFAWMLIGLLTKLLFFAGIALVAYFLIKGTGGTGGSGPQEDVVGKRPPFPHQSTSNTSNNSRVPAGVELAQTFLNKRKRQEATREVSNDQDS